MDCSICNPVPFHNLRPPRNIICMSCYEGARTILSLMNKPDVDKTVERPSNSCYPTLCKGLANALKWVKEMKEVEDQQHEKIKFLTGFSSAYKDQVHSDIQVIPGDNGPPIPAHRALLATKSMIFKNMLESDECKVASDESISLTELSHEELESLLEFLYNGTLPPEKLKKHVYTLSVASNKYEIPYLQKICGQLMLETLNSGNVLDVLENSDVCCNQIVKDNALNFIIKNMEDVVFSSRFDTFALKNPHLCVEITRASFKDTKLG